VYFNAIEEKFGSLIKLLLKMKKTARKAICLQKPSCTFCTECQLLTPKYSGVHPGGLCLAVMTGRFVPQVLSIKADKIQNAVTAGL